MDKNQLIATALASPKESIKRVLTDGLRKAYPALTIVAVQNVLDVVRRFAAKGHCFAEAVPDFDQDQLLMVWDDEAHYMPEITWTRVVWEGSTFEFINFSLVEGMHRHPYTYLIGPNPQAVENFSIAVDKFGNDVDQAVLVFNDGCWSFDEELFEDIQGSTFDNLILPPGLLESIRDDIANWLNSRELYESHRIPWKRGLILVGPPGNGKTHLIKSLVNYFGLNALYVRNFGASEDEYAENIKSVFQKARACAPALLILEDLDSLVNQRNRSYFLNELDGFALNTGILVVASANDPARLDPALVNRPSRFDRRYVFDLPEHRERSRYLAFLTAALIGDLKIGEQGAERIAAETEGFSFAYLKELVLSSMMAWISAGRTESMAEAILRQVGPLREQMTLGPDGFAEEFEAENQNDPGGAFYASMRRFNRARARVDIRTL